VLVLLMRGIYDIRHLDCLNGMIGIPSSINISTYVQAVLRFCLSNLKGCNVGITGGRDL
jgi:hypothetical protein